MHFDPAPLEKETGIARIARSVIMNIAESVEHSASHPGNRRRQIIPG